MQQHITAAKKIHLLVRVVKWKIFRTPPIVVKFKLKREAAGCGG
jgi:hypothetical protein